MNCQGWAVDGWYCGKKSSNDVHYAGFSGNCVQCGDGWVKRGWFCGCQGDMEHLIEDQIQIRSQLNQPIYHLIEFQSKMNKNPIVLEEPVHVRLDEQKLEEKIKIEENGIKMQKIINNFEYRIYNSKTYQGYLFAPPLKNDLAIITTNHKNSLTFHDFHFNLCSNSIHNLFEIEREHDTEFIVNMLDNIVHVEIVNKVKTKKSIYPHRSLDSIKLKNENIVVILGIKKIEIYDMILEKISQTIPLEVQPSRVMEMKQKIIVGCVDGSVLIFDYKFNILKTLYYYTNVLQIIKINDTSFGCLFCPSQLIDGVYSAFVQYDIDNYTEMNKINFKSRGAYQVCLMNNYHLIFNSIYSISIYDTMNFKLLKEIALPNGKAYRYINSTQKYFYGIQGVHSGSVIDYWIL